METGSLLGDGIKLAIDAGFKTVISIEIAKKYYDHCINRFKGNDNVKLHIGDSADILGNVIKDINEPITFWLDGHYSGEACQIGKYLSPLIQELDILKLHPIKTHTILIDDIRCWKDISNEYHDNFDMASVTQKILEINDKYKVDFIDGVQTRVRKGRIKTRVFPKDILVATV